NSNTAHSRLRAARKQFCSYFELPSSREEIATRTRPLRERPEQPSAQACARSRALLIAALGKGTLGGAGGGLGLAALGQGLLGKLAAVAGVLLVVGVGWVAVEREREVEVEAREPGRAPGSTAGAIVEVTKAEPDPVVAEPEPEPIPVVAPAVRRVAKSSVDPYALVREARSSLIADQPAQALELLAKIPASSPTLRGERAATEIAALGRLDRGPEARAVAKALAAAGPRPPLLARGGSACWSLTS